MVAYSPGRFPAAAGCNPCFYRRFGHRLGTLPVFLSHARATQRPWHLGILS